MNKKNFENIKKEILEEISKRVSDYLDEVFEDYGNQCHIDIRLEYGGDEFFVVKESEDTDFSNINFDTL